MQILVVALFLVLPLTLLLCLATDSVQSDNTWLGIVLHLYISATCVLLTLAAFLFKGLLLLPLYLAVLTINFLLWLFNCNETVVDQIIAPAAAAADPLWPAHHPRLPLPQRWQAHQAGRRDDPAAELQGRLGVCPQREEGGPRQVLASCHLPTI